MTYETKKNVPFFYKERKRTQRSFSSFEKNGCPTLPPASTGLLNWAYLATVQSLCEDLATLCANRWHHLVAVHVEGFPVWCNVSTGVVACGPKGLQTASV